jgi:hypothetical protein
VVQDARRERVAEVRRDAGPEGLQAANVSRVSRARYHLAPWGGVRKDAAFGVSCQVRVGVGRGGRTARRAFARLDTLLTRRCPSRPPRPRPPEGACRTYVHRESISIVTNRGAVLSRSAASVCAGRGQSWGWHGRCGTRHPADRSLEGPGRTDERAFIEGDADRPRASRQSDFRRRGRYRRRARR